MALTLRQQLASLKDFILQYNPYFNDGFAEVFQHESGHIATTDKIVFPADDNGNYFYLRLPNQLQAVYQNNYKIADDWNGIGVKYDVILVAYAQNADSSLMLQNIITTIGQCSNHDIDITMTKFIYQDDDVVTQELGKIGKENLEAALEKFPDNIGICSVHFSLTVPFVFQKLNCIQSPCNDC